MYANTFEFRQKGKNLDLYVNEQRTNIRIYPVQTGDEPVTLSADGRILPSTMWYAKGSLGDDDGTTRSYVSRRAALQGEQERISKWYISYEKEKNHFIPQKLTPVIKKAGDDFFKILIKEDAIDTGFTVEKSDNSWNFFYDGAVWGNAKTWDDTITVMGHIIFYAGSLLCKGPKALKEFIARYTWKDGNKIKTLFDDGKKTGFVVQPGYGGFICSHNGSSPEEVFPTMEEAQIEAKLRYTKEKFDSLMGQLAIEEGDDDYEDEEL
jgi:hypothetical protein